MTLPIHRNLITELCDRLLENEDQDINKDMLDAIFAWHYEMPTETDPAGVVHDIVAPSDCTDWPLRDLFLNTHVTDWLRDATALARADDGADDMALYAPFWDELRRMVRDNEDADEVGNMVTGDLLRLRERVSHDDADLDDVLVRATELKRNNELLNFLLTGEL